MHSRQNMFFTFSGVMEGWDLGNPLCGNNTKTGCSYLKQKCFTFKLTVISWQEMTFKFPSGNGRTTKKNMLLLQIPYEFERHTSHACHRAPSAVWVATRVLLLFTCTSKRRANTAICSLMGFLKSIKWCHVGFKTTRSKLDSGDFLNPKYVQSTGPWRWRRDDVAKQAA
jgi:hypothetical protein